MDNRAIGVFDSGIGGLAVLKRLAESFPDEDFVYLGDNGNVPYGSRTRDEIKILAKRSFKTLSELNVKAIVIACNTVSVCFDEESVFGVPIFKFNPVAGVLALPHVAGCFLGTSMTIKAVEDKACISRDEKIDFICPGRLASDIENCVVLGKNCVLNDHLMTTDKKYGFIFLGCTHYLFVKEDIRRFFKVDTLFDGVDSLVQNLFYYLEKYNIYAQNIQAINFVGEFADINRHVYGKIPSR